MSSEIEETFERIARHKGVQHVFVVNSEGIPIRHISRKLDAEGNPEVDKTTQEPIMVKLDNDTVHKYSANLSQLASKARSVVRDLDPQNDLTFLRIRSKKHEIMVAPDKDFLLIVIQDPTVSSAKSK